MDVQDQELSDEYLSSLVDLTVNSKLLIDMLTTLAQENVERGSVIVETVAQHINKVDADFKLPVLYLIDSIVKNVGGEYKTLFSHAIVNIFCGVFEKVNEKIRHKMYLLRQTWSNDVFPASKLYMLDVKAHRIDNNWPIAPVPKPAIHVNPNFLKSKPDDEMQTQLRQKERELLELKKRKLELELVATQKHIEEQEKALNEQTSSVMMQMNPLPVAGATTTAATNIACNTSITPLLCTPQMRPRIAPVSSALLASVRFRDPRLARQAHAQPSFPRFANATMLHSYGPRPSVQTALSTTSTATYTTTTDAAAIANPTISAPVISDATASAKPKNSGRPKSDKSPTSSEKTRNRNSGSSSSSSIRSVDRKESKKLPKRRSGDTKKASPKTIDSPRKSQAADAKVSSTSDIEAKESPMRASPVRIDCKRSDSPPSPVTVSPRIANDTGSGSVKVATVTSTSDMAAAAVVAIVTGREDEFPSTSKKRLSHERIESVNKKSKTGKLDELFGNEDVDLRKDVVMSMPRIPRRRPSATTASVNDEPIKKIARESRLAQRKSNATNSTTKPLSSSLSKQQSDRSPVVAPLNIVDMPNMLTPISDEENDFSSSSDSGRSNKISKITDRKRNERKVSSGMDVPRRVKSKWSAPLEQIAPVSQVPAIVVATQQQQLQPQPLALANDADIAAAAAVSQAAERLQKLQPSLSMSIDGVIREIRFYGEVAVAFMGDKATDPHEVGFQAGQRRVLVNSTHTITLNFNDVYRPFAIGDDILQIRFGTPIRELYINQQWYECFFGEPPAVIVVDGKKFLIQIEGPAPQIQIGHRRTDLVAGTINMFIDTTTIVPLFLDCQLQYFILGQQLHTIQFADYLLTVLIDGETFAVDYGAMPKRFRIGGIQRYIRFSVLPKGLRAGHVTLVNMRRTDRPGVTTPPPPPAATPPAPQQLPQQQSVALKTDAEAPPAVPAEAETPPPAPALSIDDLLQKLVASGVLSSNNSQGATVDETETKPKKNEKSSKRSNRSSEPKAPSSSLSAKRVDLSKPKSIRHRCSENIAALFAGLQCASCGVRFPSDQTVKYSQHLDWHFRQNRRDRELARRAQSRPWFYKVTDWIQYEEIEDLDDREKNWFEQQASGDGEIGSDDSGGGRDISQQPTAQSNEESVVPSCVAGPNDTDKTCEMCHDPFETFYNEDMEEWHLQNAVRVDETTAYHPACLQEMNAKEEAAKNESLISDGFDDNAVDIAMGEVSITEEAHIILDDDVVEVPTNEAMITEILDEDEIVVKTESAQPSPLVIAAIDADELLTYEPIGDESDIQILVPQVDTLNLDEYEEKELPEVDAAGVDAELLPVKIKEEPIDNGYKDVDGDDYEDVFEEVGILLADIEQIEASTNAPNPEPEHTTEADASPVVPTAYSQAQITPLDGNVEPDVETTASHHHSSANKIKININKIVSKIVVQSSEENTVNLNEPTTSGTADKPSTELNLAAEEPPEIAFTYKKSMEGVAFKKIPLWKGGRDTSGLCSIM